MNCILCNTYIDSPKGHLKQCAMLLPKPKHPRMTHEWNRRLTFKNWPGKFSEEFVKSGLYFTGDEDILKCCWCNHAMGQWVSEEDPLERHLNEQPDCMFIFDQCNSISVCPYCIRMVPKTKRKRAIEEHSEQCLETAIATLNEVGQFPRNFRMANSSLRLKSFKNWLNTQTPVQDFIKSGFYWTEKEQKLTCFYCHAAFEDDLPFEELLEKHYKLSPCCLFARKKFLSQTFKNLPKKDQSSYSPEMQKRNQDRLLCIICCEKEKEVVFRNCGHFISCKSCANGFDKCPICRENISDIMKVYI